MAIDPLGTGGVPETGSRRIEAQPPENDPTGARAALPAAADSVEFSATARELAAPDIPSGTLPVNDLQAITAKLAGGSYNSDAVVEAIATAIRQELQ